MRMVASIAARLATGSEPGRPRHTGQICVLGSAPNAVRQPQNIFVRVPSSTCTSSPMTGSYRLTTDSTLDTAVALMLLAHLTNGTTTAISLVCNVGDRLRGRGSGALEG